MKEFPEYISLALDPELVMYRNDFVFTRAAVYYFSDIDVGNN